jgi:hypothetical protein
MSVANVYRFDFIPPPSRKGRNQMRNSKTRVRQVVHRVLQFATMPAVAMTLQACSSLERTSGADVTARRAAAVMATPKAEYSLPMCNAPDNRQPEAKEESACTAADNLQNTITIKVPTEGVENVQTVFLCLCGNANLEPPSPEVEAELNGLKEEFEQRNKLGEELEIKDNSSTITGQFLTILSKNPKCLSWTWLGGSWVCTGGWV